MEFFWSCVKLYLMWVMSFFFNWSFRSCVLLCLVVQVLGCLFDCIFYVKFLVGFVRMFEIFVKIILLLVYQVVYVCYEIDVYWCGLCVCRGYQKLGENVIKGFLDQYEVIDV